MNSKLTLSINQSTIEDAKKYAKSNGRSLSNIVEEYLKSLTSKLASEKDKDSMKIVRELRGSLKADIEFSSYKEIITDVLIDKHIK